MRSPYFYILMRSPLLVYSNKMEYNKRAWWCITYRVLMEKKMKYNKPNTKRKTRKRKKNKFSAAAEKWRKRCRGRGGIHPGCC